jgi:hypothetical protein
MGEHDAKSRRYRLPSIAAFIAVLAPNPPITDIPNQNPGGPR